MKHYTSSGRPPVWKRSFLWAAMLLFPFFVLPAQAQTGQGLDNAGNGSLTGNYYFRWVNFSATDGSGAFSKATALYGAIHFDGNGAYHISGQMTDSKNSPGQATSFTASGTYVVASSGLAELSNPVIPGTTLWALVGTEAVVGNTAFPGEYDLFVAIPAPTGSASNQSMHGSYQAGSLDFLQGKGQFARSALFALKPDGNGNFAPFTPSGSAANLKTLPPQAVTGATYTVNNDGSATANFPFPAGLNPNQTLVGGSKVLYVSADGAVLLGGSGTGFDMIVGMQALTGDATKAYQGLYFYSELTYDLSSDSLDLYTDSGGRNVQSGNWSVYDSQNESWGGDLYATDITNAGPVESFGPDGVATQDDYYRVVGAGGQMYFTVGRTSVYYLSVGVHARPVTGSGVFLSPYGVVDAANLAPTPNPIAPGEFISLFGSGFAASATGASIPLPNTLAGVQVLINGRLAPLSFVGSNQINAIVPYATKEPYAAVQVVVNGKSSNIVTLYTRDANASVYTIPAGGFGTAAVLHADYSPVSQSSGARPGETILVFLTGLGATSPPMADGAAAPSNPLCVVPPAMQLSANVGGYDATISFAGLAPGFAGLYQINLVIPQNVISDFTVPGPTVQALPLNIWNSEDWKVTHPVTGDVLTYSAGFSTFSKVIVNAGK